MRICGVYGHTKSPDGTAVRGLAEAESGGAYAGSFETRSPGGRAVFGRASSTTGANYGAQFISESTSGRAVFGDAQAISGATIGGYFLCRSSSGQGVVGWAASGSGVNYGVWGQSDSSSGFDFYAGGAGTNYGSSSSIRWKSNIEMIDDPLYKIAKLRGVYFDWDAEHGGHHDVGMIAEEVGKVMPEIVQYEENGTDAIGMDYSKLTPLLVEAVKALDEENQKLRERLATLEALVTQLTSEQKGAEQ